MISQHGALQVTEDAPRAKPLAREVAVPSGGRWLSVVSAAAFLDLEAVTLRRKLDRASRKDATGGVTATVDGIVGRKLGRLWRVYLPAEWVRPSGVKEGAR